MRYRLICALASAALLPAVGTDIADASARHSLKVDATALTSSPFYIAEIGWREGTSVETVDLSEGTHYLQPNSGVVMACPLTVTAAWEGDLDERIAIVDLGAAD